MEYYSLFYFKVQPHVSASGNIKNCIKGLRNFGEYKLGNGLTRGDCPNWTCCQLTCQKWIIFVNSANTQTIKIIWYCWMYISYCSKYYIDPVSSFTSISQVFCWSAMWCTLYTILPYCSLQALFQPDSDQPGCNIPNRPRWLNWDVFMLGKYHVRLYYRCCKSLIGNDYLYTNILA